MASPTDDEAERARRGLDKGVSAATPATSPAGDLGPDKGSGQPESSPDSRAATAAPAERPATPEAARRGATQPRFAAGDLVADRYKILRFIAQGGMGEVYEAEDLTLHGRLALKTIHSEDAGKPSVVVRFKREIQIARRITHPNVCRVYDVGVHSSTPETLFLTMEFLAGETLQARVAQKGRMSEVEAFPLLEQMAAGLAAAHEAGIIHRDFKSSNVMLVPTAGGSEIRAVITDFGLARPTESDDGIATLTEAGAMVGTPAFMAPEQVKGLKLTPAADVYALGIVLYEMVTGKRPFHGDTPMSTAVKRLLDPPPPPSQHVPSLDPQWEAVILRCLERDPATRFPGPLDVVRALQTGETPTSVLAAGRGLHSKMRAPQARWLLVGGLAAVAVLSFVGIRAGLPALKKMAARLAGSESTAPAGSPRAIAIFGLKNNSERAESVWLSTAIAEILTTELAADGKLRVVPGQDVTRVKMDMGLKEAESLPTDALRRIRQNLGVENVVLGSYTMVGDPGARLLRIDLRLVEAETGEVLTSATTSGTEVQLFDLVSRAGASLRQRLGVGDLSARQTLEVGASLPADPEAARLYTEGLSRLRAFDIQGASGLLEKAVAAEPKHPMPHAALAAAYSKQGFETRAKEEASQAVALSGSLGHSQQLQLEARFLEVTKEWGKAVEARRSLFQSYPGNVDCGVDLADIQIAAGKTKEAFVTLEALRKLPAPASGDARIDLLEARAHQGSGDFRKQQALAVAAATKGRASGARLLVAQARLVEAMALQFQGDIQGATAAVDEARSLFDASGDRGGTARALELTFTSVDRQGDLEGGRRLLAQALSIYREIGDRSSEARVLLNMGNVLVRKGKTSEAQKLFDEALTTFRQTGAKHAAAVALNDIGMMLHNRGDLLAAQTRYQEALTLFSELGEKSGIATTLTNIAEVLQCRGDLDQAFKMHEDSLAINRAIGDKSGIAYDLFQLGEVHFLRGDLIAARDRYKEALALQEQTGDRLASADTRLALASLALAQGRASEAEVGAREAEEILRTQGSVEHGALALAVVGESLLSQGKATEARKLAARAASLGRKSDNRRIRYATAIAEARVLAASKRPQDVEAALESLEVTASDAAKGSFVGSAFEARLALGEIEMAIGRAAAGRKRLQTLEVDAKAKGFGQIARRAAAAGANPPPRG